MKKVITVVSFILIASFIVYRIGKEDAPLPNQNRVKNVDVVSKNKSVKPKFSHRSESIKEIVQDESQVKNIIREITNTDISVFERTPKILSLRNLALTDSDEKEILTHLKKVDLKESQSIKNDLIEHMIRYGKDQALVGRTLLDIMRNSGQDRVVREYVLQYIPEYYLNRWSPGKLWDDVEAQDRQLFNETMREMTNLTEGSMAGGALFALHRLADRYDDIDQQEVFKKAQSILIDPGYMNPNRMGAVQVLAFSNNEEYYETAREIVMDKNQPVLLQVTAMHTAAQSQFLDKNFISYLTQISKGGIGVHPSLQKCARLTLLKIK